ncbi:MAG: S-layer homology domain-containing protein [Chloroflexi bacterium]|nr:S-layer homology domain-containing protein [Chloroflexota bacterium]
MRVRGISGRRRRRGGRAASRDYFTDDNSNKHESAINRLREAGITFGCGGVATTFCPDGSVTRGQMAAFLHRALGD